MPPQALGQHWQLSQSVTLETGATVMTDALSDQPHSLLVAWSVSKQGLNFVGLTPSGHVLMTLRYDGDRFSEEYSPALTLTRRGMSLPGREIIAQLQLTYWPLAAINQQLKATPWRIVATDHGRSLYLGKRQILDIHITPADHHTGLEEVIRITNTLMDYRLNIGTLTRAVLP